VDSTGQSSGWPALLALIVDAKCEDRLSIGVGEQARLDDDRGRPSCNGSLGVHSQPRQERKHDSDPDGNRYSEHCGGNGEHILSLRSAPRLSGPRVKPSPEAALEQLKRVYEILRLWTVLRRYRGVELNQGRLGLQTVAT
jgi:hypothetical protein